MAFRASANCSARLFRPTLLCAAPLLVPATPELSIFHYCTVPWRFFMVQSRPPQIAPPQLWSHWSPRANSAADPQAPRSWLHICPWCACSFVGVVLVHLVRNKLILPSVPRPTAVSGDADPAGVFRIRKLHLSIERLRLGIG